MTLLCQRKRVSLAGKSNIFIMLFFEPQLSFFGLIMLTDQVRLTVRIKLVSIEDGAFHAREDDDAIIEDATNRGVQVITLHRKDIAKQRTID